jgi:hypothetical protein
MIVQVYNSVTEIGDNDQVFAPTASGPNWLHTRLPVVGVAALLARSYWLVRDVTVGYAGMDRNK